MKYQRRSAISHLYVFNANNDLRLDKKAENEYDLHPAAFLINEMFPWRTRPPLRQAQSRARQEVT